jgi:hypothetical protein
LPHRAVANFGQALELWSQMATPRGGGQFFSSSRQDLHS